VPKSIQGLLQQIDRVRCSGVDEAFRLLAVDSLLEVVVEKGILHVELAHGLVSGRSNAEDGADRGRLDNRAECLIVVDAFLLGEATDDLARLVLDEGAVGAELMFEQPLASDNVRTRR
jgi:hypothetical protein